MGAHSFLTAEPCLWTTIAFFSGTTRTILRVLRETSTIRVADVIKVSELGNQHSRPAYPSHTAPCAISGAGICLHWFLDPRLGSTQQVALTAGVVLRRIIYPLPRAIICFDSKAGTQGPSSSATTTTRTTTAAAIRQTEAFGTPHGSDNRWLHQLRLRDGPHEALIAIPERVGYVQQSE